MANAWMLRNDGEAIPVKVHLYCMQDDDFSSEAEVASFMLQYSKQDHHIAKMTLDAWMTMLIVDKVMYDYTPQRILDILKKELNNLPYKFPFPLSVEQYINIHDELGNWNDFDSMMDFCDEMESKKSSIWDNQSRSLNQQFCRSRFGGVYDTVKGNGEMVFRVSSIGFNWVDVIYVWTINNSGKLGIETVTICRDRESDYGFADNGGKDKFYKAKDGTIYYQMPVDEFLSGEHESNPVFASVDQYNLTKPIRNFDTYSISQGVLASIRQGLYEGDSIYTIISSIGNELIPWNTFDRIKNQEIRNCGEVKGVSRNRNQYKP